MKNNLSIKLLSLFFAIVLWFYIIQVQSPEVDKTVKDVPVLFAQRAELESRNLMLLNDKEYTVDLKIRGQRKYLLDLDKTNLSVSADVSSIEGTGTHTVYARPMIPYGNVEVVSQNPSIITVSVDEIVEVEKEVRVNTLGIPANGYKVGGVKTTPSTVKVRGAKSIVGGIDYIAVSVDVGGKTEDISSLAEVRLMGAGDTEINSTYATASHQTVNVHCEILKRKKVQIEPKFEGVSYDGSWYSLDDNSVKTLEIAGAASVVDKLEKIETKPITSEMIEEDGEVEVALDLPTGVESLSGDKIRLKLKRNR